MKRLTIIALALGAILVSACGGGYTQEEVDALVADAVDTAVADAKDDIISEQEAQEQAEAAAQQADQAAKQASLQAAMETCGLDSPSNPSHRFITVDGDGSGMFIDGSDGYIGADIVDITCILAALDTPESVLGRISSTTSLMGLVEGAWGDYQAEWSYHPDNGLDISISVVS